MKVFNIARAARNFCFFILATERSTDSLMRPGIAILPLLIIRSFGHFQLPVLIKKAITHKTELSTLFRHIVSLHGGKCKMGVLGSYGLSKKIHRISKFRK